ncbi:hypothetical protein soil367_16975 [Hydrocarboniclastica marina]|uniref:DGQHR domain-containing protein n=2 Tax=Hydrocarboniclastica marina TaxID=2259620 RepID=A0A4P7XK42_9ALTE|nr:hypothetical protein soil367_16975 [Hydrocarboniclastica marina]
MPEEIVKKPNTKPKYDKELLGIFGHLGNEQSKVKFIQLNLGTDELDLLGLVSEIPGSEQWSIRQLFQRDIDEDRVEDEIIPYFKDPSTVKFFNPLTIAVLPIDNHGQLCSDLVEEDVDVDSADSSRNFSHAYAVDGFYRVSHDAGVTKYGLLHWDTSKVKLIAIDGQHRLYALKRLLGVFRQNPSDEALGKVGFKSWKIPIVLVTLGHSSQIHSTEGLLEKTRGIFVTINKQAKQPTRSRTILLNDYSVTAVATQEVLDSARSQGIPLAFFNWRDYRDEPSEAGTTYLVGVDELEDIIKGYLIGEDADSSSEFKLTNDQERAVLWNEQATPPPLDSPPVELREAFRSRYRETVLPAVFYILYKIEPVASYIEYLTDIENGLKNDVEKHAWSRIVYGSDYAPENMETKVRERKHEFLKSCGEKKREMGNIYSRVVGLRAIFSGFCEFSDVYTQYVTVEPWLDLAKKFEKSFNHLFRENVLLSYELTNNVALDSSGSIINYKVDQVKKGLGAAVGYACLFISAEREYYELEELRDRVFKTMVAGYRRDLRPGVKEDYVGRPNNEITEEVNRRADSAAQKQIKRLEKKLNKLLLA